MCYSSKSVKEPQRTYENYWLCKHPYILSLPMKKCLNYSTSLSSGSTSPFNENTRPNRNKWPRCRGTGTSFKVSTAELSWPRASWKVCAGNCNVTIKQSRSVDSLPTFLSRMCYIENTIQLREVHLLLWLGPFTDLPASHSVLLAPCNVIVLLATYSVVTEWHHQ